MNITKPKEIFAENLLLKEIPETYAYAEKLFDIFCNDEEVLKFWLERKLYKNPQDILDSYKQKNKEEENWQSAMYGIFQNNELLGQIGLSGIDVKNKTAELGYWLKKSARGKGVINKVLPLIENLGFQTYNLRKLYIWSDSENIASKKIAGKNGYLQEGLLRERKIWPDGCVRSTVIFGKLKSEWAGKDF